MRGRREQQRTRRRQALPPHRPTLQVSLAFLARGSAEPLMAYLPEQLQRVGAWPLGAIAKVQEELSKQMARVAITDLPPAATEVVRLLGLLLLATHRCWWGGPAGRQGGGPCKQSRKAEEGAAPARSRMLCRTHPCSWTASQRC